MPGLVLPTYYVFKVYLAVRDALVTALTAQDGVMTRLGIGDSTPTTLTVEDE